MVLEQDPIDFWRWLGPGLIDLLLIMLVGVPSALAICYLACAVRYGPMRGGDVLFKGAVAGALDLIQARPRRVLALARLAIQESLRRKVWVALALFVVVLMFAGWFLDPNTFDPAKLYLNFVLKVMTYLVLVLALFLSVFSLPADLKNHTIYTIVTKPVRRSEIFLGRLLGFTTIGAGFLLAMGLLGYGFVMRSVTHSHTVDVASLQAAPHSSKGLRVGKTDSVQGHSHHVIIDASGAGSTDVERGHWHQVTPSQGGKSAFVVGPPEDVFLARVPKYGSLSFKNRDGQPDARGISVGNEWSYRSFIEGGTPASATWTVKDITPEQFPDGLPVEMTIRVFRSWKGNMNRGILGSLTLRNPKTHKTSREQNFECKDNQIDRRLIPRKLHDTAGKSIDLFDDLVTPDGTVEIVLRCVEPAQYFGMAKADLYLRATDRPFTWNYVKGLLGIWFQMLLVTGFSLFFSTFLSAPVAMLAEISTIILGFCTKFILDLAMSVAHGGAPNGGGPFESLIRIPEQMNMTSPLEDGLTKTVVQFLDACVLLGLEKCCSLLPDFRDFNNIDHVAFGFDIPIDNLLRQGALCAVYLLALVVAGTFILKSREVAQ